MEGVCRERRPQTGGGADLPARGVAGSGRALILSADTTHLYVQPPALIPTYRRQFTVPSSRSALPPARGHWRAASIIGLASKLYYYRVPIKRRDYTLAPDRPPARGHAGHPAARAGARPRPWPGPRNLLYLDLYPAGRIETNFHRRVRWNGTIPQYRAISLLRLRASGRSRHARKRPVRSRHVSQERRRGGMAVAPRTRARVPAPPNDVIILMITLIMVNAHSVLVQQSRGSQSAVDSTP